MGAKRHIWLATAFLLLAASLPQPLAHGDPARDSRHSFEESHTLVGQPAAYQESSGGALHGGQVSMRKTADPYIAAAGDISCDESIDPHTATTCHDLETSNLIYPNTAVGHGGTCQGLTICYRRALMLGDGQYENGTLSAYQAYYDVTWGRFKSITRPVPGNHQYHSTGAAGYFRYFGSVAGLSGQGYYSYNLGNWHVIALNANLNPAYPYGGTTSQWTAQLNWLVNDINANALSSTPRPCILAYWHQPRFASTPQRGHPPDQNVQPFWNRLYTAGDPLRTADIVLNGHNHVYERFAKMTATGGASPNGIREFIVGTGGKNFDGARNNVAPNSQFYNGSVFGILRLSLQGSGYKWAFISEGKAILDRGSDTCNI